MTLKQWLGCGVFTMSLLWGVFASAAVVTSTFDTDNEGWRAVGDSTSVVTQWSSTIGAPAGSAYANDQVAGGTWRFLAPAKFLGNHADAYGQTLSFDLRITASDSVPWGWAMVAMTGSGITLNWNGTWPTVNVWNHYEAQLNAAGGWLKASDNTAPTPAEFAAALGNLTNLEIRGEYKTGSDTGYLDNVVLVPEPASVTLLVLGVYLGLRRPRAA